MAQYKIEFAGNDASYFHHILATDTRLQKANKGKYNNTVRKQELCSIKLPINYSR